MKTFRWKVCAHPKESQWVLKATGVDFWVYIRKRKRRPIQTPVQHLFIMALFTIAKGGATQMSIDG
jgi:hypothetical protein